jgi:hypothetical protein
MPLRTGVLLLDRALMRVRNPPAAFQWKTARTARNGVTASAGLYAFHYTSSGLS